MAVYGTYGLLRKEDLQDQFAGGEDGVADAAYVAGAVFEQGAFHERIRG